MSGRLMALVPGPDATGQRASVIAGHADKLFVGRHLIEDGQKPLRFRKDFVVVVRFDLDHDIVDPQSVIPHGALVDPTDRFPPGKGLRRCRAVGLRGIDCVVKGGFVRLAALLIAESFLPQIGDALVDVEVGALKIMQFSREIEDFLCDRCADCKGCGLGSSSS